MSTSSTFATCWTLFYLVTCTDSQAVSPPSIESGPLPTTMYLGSTGDVLALTCSATGNPAPSIEWYRNDQQIPNENRMTLTLTPDTANVDGYYRCAVVSNRYGKAWSNITKVMQAKIPAFEVVKLSQLTVQLGDKLAIPCHPLVSGIPKPQQSSFIWKEGDAIMTFDGRKQIDEEGALYFSAVTSDDLEKVRKCTIHNSVMKTYVEQSSGSKISKSNDPEVTSRAPAIFFYSNMTANLNAPMTVVVALVGRDVSLRCFFSGSGHISIEWRREYIPKMDYYRMTDNQKGELLIRGVVDSDDDVYICTGSNGVGNRDFRTKLVVHAEPTFRSESNRPHNINATVGEDVVVRCMADAKPTADIKWYKNGVELNPKAYDDSRYHWSSDLTELTIENLCKSDCASGLKSDIMVIQCNASNQHNYTFSNGYINVFEKTLFVQHLPESKSFDQLGEPLVLTVEAETDPTTPIEFQWYRNGRRISENDPVRRITHRSDGKGSTLTINSTKLDDIEDVIYTCNATNGVSTATTKISVSTTIRSATVWIALLVLLVVLFIVGISLAIGCAVYQNRGEDYPVDETERKQGNNPEQDIEDADFHPFMRKERGSQSDVGSLHSHASTEKRYDEESTLIRERLGSQGQMYS